MLGTLTIVFEMILWDCFVTVCLVTKSNMMRHVACTYIIIKRNRYTYRHTNRDAIRFVVSSVLLFVLLFRFRSNYERAATHENNSDFSSADCWEGCVRTRNRVTSYGDLVTGEFFFPLF